MGEIAQPRPTISVERATEFDIKEAMQGSNGNPTYEQQFGMTSAPLGTVGAAPQNGQSLAQLEIDAQLALARATNPMGFANQGFEVTPQVGGDLGAMQAELDRFKKLYGDSENEKGAARQREAQLMEAFNGLMSQYESLQQTPQRQSWEQPPQPFAPQFTPQMPQFTDPFEGVSENEFLDGKTARNVLERAVGQSTAFMAGQVQQAMQRTANLERQLLAQARASAGISKLDEFRIVGKNPWLNRLPEGERLNAILSLKATEAPLQSNGSGSAVQPTVASETQNRILNKVTYIEGTNPNVPDMTEAAVEAAKQRDYALAMNENPETGARARSLRAFANKYGLNIGQNPSDIAR